ncbi:L-threonylcarbamoyladenylate synthase [Pseudomonas sp. N040]|uniref:L-threonylcarbamoyladenylate synthase n=1 Tax=Pseudomonas sp. N040 TaxID=2785325 RepID=UPI0018A24C42|nr:L-threonylcarbamoyladenylate synthase [Pseudomonas sp. N040]MBF7728790.1 threonylcarbamoyl-AMP synthase [Pseudomonas sp. N040]MBW7012430.1 threonylcarbamoyl-AMP synthase [Pseudomonas sp. N040]
MPLLTTCPQLACERLKAGELLALPTETVYGLAADARNQSAVAKVFALKGRPASNPLIIHLASAEQAQEWARDITAAAQRLMKAFWPGPLTLVLPAHAHVSRSITAGQDSVALRVPAHPLALEVLRRFDGGLVAPSANRYMSISPTCAAHVGQQFADSDLLILDGGESAVGLESTIVSLLPNDQPRLLREGMLSPGQIEAVLGAILLRGADSAVRVPGQHKKHYAPTTPSWRFAQTPVADLGNPQYAWLWCGEGLATAGPSISLGNEPSAYAQGLYAALYQLDGLGLQRLLIQLPTEAPAWLAVHDRLARASQLLA